MISTLNAAHKVAVLKISVDPNHEYNQHLISEIATNYTNIYNIEIIDHNNSVDQQLYQLIKQLLS